MMISIDELTGTTTFIRGNESCILPGLNAKGAMNHKNVYLTDEEVLTLIKFLVRTLEVK